MPRRRNGRSSRDSVIYIHVPAAAQEVIVVEVVMVPALIRPQNKLPIVNCPDDGNVAMPHHSEDFDGIEIHGVEFAFD